MSTNTAENINANQAFLTHDMIRNGFFRFPQSEFAEVGPALWPQIAEIQLAEGYPFKVLKMAGVPFGEVWFVNRPGTVLRRIVNVKIIVGPTAVTGNTLTQNDALDFQDQEYEGQQGKTTQQLQRRLKDGNL